MHTPIPTFAALAVAATLSFAAFSGPAQAQPFNTEVMTKCAQVVGPMKFEGWAADRNREMMMLGCQSNAGSIPGAAGPTSEKPVSLPHRQPARLR